MSHNCDVAIVGGGVVGLTVALAMGQRGFTVAIIDAGPLSIDLAHNNLRVYAVNQSSQVLLQQLAVWQELDSASISPYQRMHVWDNANNARICFDARLVAAPQLGYIIPEILLKEALLKQLNQQPTVKLFPTTKIAGLAQQSNGISISDERNQWSARLLIAADGANSLCRSLLNIPVISWPYHQEAIIATVSTEKSHEQTAFQMFNSKGTLAFLPLSDPNQCSIVWSTLPTTATQLTALSEEAFNQELTREFFDILGKVSLHNNRRQQFPLVMRHAKKYSGPNWLLIGDAAHTVHPLAGLGLNLGLADVATWLNGLDESKGNLVSRKTLGSYHRQRKYAIWKIIVLLSGLKTLFTNPLPPVKALRGFGLTICNSVTPLKRMFIEYASGKPMLD